MVLSYVFLYKTIEQILCCSDLLVSIGQQLCYFMCTGKSMYNVLCFGDMITTSYIMEEVSFWGRTLLVRWSVPPLLRFDFFSTFLSVVCFCC